MGGKYRKRAIIDVETLEVWPSLYDCAKALGVKPPAVFQAIIRNGRCGGARCKPYAGQRKVEYFDYWWAAYTPAEKESYSKKNGIFWL